MKKFGLIGFPLEHSFSKKYFTEKFKTENITDCIYENYPLSDISQISELIKSEHDLIGLNVTIPYKEKVLAYLNEFSDEAWEIGAVNTVKIIRISEGFKLKGFNTDISGFKGPLIKILQPCHKSALILGTGGASKAVEYVLRKLNISYSFVSRNPKNKSVFSYNDLTSEIISEYMIIINTSPVGMYPNVDAFPDIPYDAITPRHILYDLIYNPEKTSFLLKGETKKATLINGLPMLHSQADKAWEIWNESD
jgi:shikimate dehydrogenase